MSSSSSSPARKQSLHYVSSPLITTTTTTTTSVSVPATSTTTSRKRSTFSPDYVDYDGTALTEEQDNDDENDTHSELYDPSIAVPIATSSSLASTQPLLSSLSRIASQQKQKSNQLQSSTAQLEVIVRTATDTIPLLNPVFERKTASGSNSSGGSSSSSSKKKKKKNKNKKQKLDNNNTSIRVDTPPPMPMPSERPSTPDYPTLTTSYLQLAGISPSPPPIDSSFLLSVITGQPISSFSQSSSLSSTSSTCSSVLSTSTPHILDITDCCRSYGAHIFTREKEQELYSTPLFIENYNTMRAHPYFSYYNATIEDPNHFNASTPSSSSSNTSNTSNTSSSASSNSINNDTIITQLESAIQLHTTVKCNIIATASCASHLLSILPTFVHELMHPTYKRSQKASSLVSQLFHAIPLHLHKKVPPPSSPLAVPVSTSPSITIGYFPNQYGSAFGTLRYSSSISEYNIDPASVSLICIESELGPPLTSDFGNHLIIADKNRLLKREEALFKKLESIKKLDVFFFEPIIGVQGVWTYRPDFVCKLFTILVERKCMIVVDEVLTGMGRCGTFLALQRYCTTRSFLSQPSFIIIGKGCPLPLIFTMNPGIMKNEGFATFSRSRTTTFLPQHTALYTIQLLKYGLTDECLKDVWRKGILITELLSKFKNSIIAEDDEEKGADDDEAGQQIAHIYDTTSPIHNLSRSRAVGLLIYLSIFTPVRVHMCAGRRLLPAYDLTDIEIRQLFSLDEIDLRYQLLSSNVYNMRTCGWCGDMVSLIEQHVKCTRCTMIYHLTCMHYCCYCEAKQGDSILAYFNTLKEYIPDNGFFTYDSTLLQEVEKETDSSSDTSDDSDDNDSDDHKSKSNTINHQDYLYTISNTTFNSRIFSSDSSYTHDSLHLVALYPTPFLPFSHFGVATRNRIAIGTILMKVKTNNITNQKEFKQANAKYIRRSYPLMRSPFSEHKPKRPYIALEVAGYDAIKTQSFDLLINPCMAIIPSQKYANVYIKHHIWEDNTADLVVFARRNIKKGELLFDQHQEKEMIARE